MKHIKFKAGGIILATVLGAYGCSDSGSGGGDPTPVNPATNPPATNPPATNPPVTNPPVTNPPVTNPPSGVTDESELQKLLGQVDFSFMFAASGEQVPLSVSWTQTAFNDDRTALFASDDENNLLVCTRGNDQPDVFLCSLRGFASADSDEVTAAILWGFTLSSPTSGSGSVKLCAIPYDFGSCLDDLNNNPDGSVSVSINPNPVALSELRWTLNGQHLTFYEAKSFMDAANAEFGGISSQRLSIVEFANPVDRLHQ